MKNSFLRLLLPIAALAFIAPGSALAQKGKGGGADSDSGPVVIPGGSYAETYVIDQPGSYVLGGDRAMSDASNHIIQITARDVTLDLGGFALSHTGTGIGAGIRVENENVEIRNGSIVAAASTGIAASGGRGLRLFDIRVVAPAQHGFVSHEYETIIQRCHVMDAGADGIHLTGDGNMVSDSIVSNCGSSGILTGYRSHVLRVIVRGSQIGIQLFPGSTLEESTVTGASVKGVSAYEHSTVRGCQIANNNVGLSALVSSVVLYGNRFAQNTTHFSGVFLNAGGNIIP